MRRGLQGFSDDVRAWRAATVGRVPVYHQLLEHAAAMFDGPAGSLEEAARARVEAAWRERKAPSPYQRPLLLMAALRAEALRMGDRHPLHRAIAAREAIEGETATRVALAEALGDATARVVADLATRAVQTNETSRALAWLWPAALAGCGGGRRPLALYDVGCSAGLNLAGDQLPPLWTDAAGAALEVVAGARVVARRGFDAHPLDVRREDDRLWLTACVWPGETARQDRLLAAMRAFTALASGPAAPVLEAADLGDVPARLEALAHEAPPHTVHLAYQTVVRDYLTEPARARYGDGMRAWLTAAQAGSPRLWIELEAPPQPVQGMTLEAHQMGPAGTLRSLTLARCGYHPDRITVDADAVAAFVESHPGS